MTDAAEQGLRRLVGGRSPAQYFHPLRPGYRFEAISTAKSFRLAREDWVG